MSTVPLTTLAGVFLRLGLTAFGGPAAHGALMEDEFVTRRGWLTRDEYLDLIGAANLIPGPNSTEVALHVGHRVAGWWGLVVAGVCFILPAAVLVTLLAWAYVTYGTLPALVGVLAGLKAVVLAVVVQALVNLTGTAVKSPGLAVLGLVSVLLVLLGVHELLVLFGAGLVAATLWGGRQRPVSLLVVLSAPAVPVAVGYGLWPLFLVFLKIGSVLFGSGYVLLAFLRADLVTRLGWLTEQQLLDAIAVGQVTPGPVFTTATFIGYLLDGPAGAGVATVGIFLPAFVFVALSVPVLPRLRAARVARAFLDGVNVASLALMAVVTWHLSRAAVVDVTTATLAVASALLLLRWRVSATWLVLGGAMVGWLRVLVA